MQRPAQPIGPVAQKFERSLGWIILAVLFLGCLIVLSPFFSALLWAVVFCFSSWPIYLRLLRLLRNRRTLAALLMSIATILIVLLPFILVGVKLADNVSDVTAALRHWLDDGPPAAPGWLGKIPLIGSRVTHYWTALAQDSSQLMQFAKRVLQPASESLLRIGAVLVAGVVEFTLSIFISFFLFRDGLAAAARLNDVVKRIAGARGHRMLQIAGNTVRGVVYGILGTALVQAVMAGIGFLVAGVPGPGVLALLTFFLSVVPMGPPIIWLPAALWLFHRGESGWGIFMLIWGVGVSSIDNFVKPLLISQGSDMPFLLILFGVVGGAISFGLIGLFLGPALLAVVYRLVTEWLAGAAEPRLVADT